MVGDEQQRPLMRHVILTLYPRAPAQSFQRPRAARSEPRFADYPVEGQNLSRQTPGRYAGERLEHRAPMTHPTQTEGEDHIVHTNPRETFEVLLVLRREDVQFLSRGR
jgi:hypothetical protein